MSNSSSITIHTKSQNFYLVIKRIIDIIFSLIGSIICLPIFLIIALVVKICDGGGSTVFFHHKRIGYKGKPITILKFRTMVPDAEERIKQFTPEQKKEWEENAKLQDDPRVTKVGKFLRKTSIDELPQIFEILTGKLSIIGPRPITEEEFIEHHIPIQKYTSVKPGLTGYWACNGRSNTSYEERTKLELYYVDHFSLWLDIKIFFKTIVSVLEHRGAL